MKGNRRGVAPVPAHRYNKQYQFDFQLSVSCILSGMNEELAFRRDHGVLVSSVWFSSIVCCLRCVGYACAYGVRRLPFFNRKKKEAKNAALKRRGVLCTAQIAFVMGQHALACEGSCKREVGCETALRAVRDGFV